METHLPDPSNQCWQTTLGFARDQLIGKILRHDWLKIDEPLATLLIEELPKPFELRFSIFRHKLGLLNYRYVSGEYKYCDSKYTAYKAKTRFDIVFNYRQCAQDLRIRDIYFKDFQREKSGKMFLQAVIPTALETGCNRVFVEPGFEGSWYWTSRGALIQRWPRSEGLDIRFKKLLNDDVTVIGWSESERKKIQCCYIFKDVDALNELVGWDHIKVVVDNILVPLRRYLFDNVTLGECIFDFDDPRTYQRLLNRVGVDILAIGNNKDALSATEPNTRASLRRLDYTL